jgi:hypothetical protein
MRAEREPDEELLEAIVAVHLKTMETIGNILIRISDESERGKQLVVQGVNKILKEMKN